MSVCAFRITTPWRRTSSGSWGSATLMAFCTSTAAMSWSRPMSKNTWRFITPLLEFDER
jgi:hypothetical protein